MADGKQLKVEITGDSKLLFQALEKSSLQVKSFAKDISTMSGAVQNTFSNMKAPIVAVLGLIGGGAFLKSAVDETKNWTIEATKLSKTLGITTESASVMNIAIGDIHGSVDEFMPIIGKLTRTINTDEEAFKRLGVATRDQKGHLRPTVDIMLDTNKALLGMKEGTDRNVEAARIYGRGWMEVRKYLGLTTETLQEAHDKAEKLNLIVGQDAVDATKAYRDSLNEFDDTTKALKVRLGAELMPVLTTLNNDMAENGPRAVSTLSNAFSGLYQMFNAIRETISKLWEEMTSFFVDAGHLAKAAGKTLWDVDTLQWGKVKGVWKQWSKDVEDEARTHALTMKSISEEYVDSTQSLMGFGPKPKPKPEPKVKPKPSKDDDKGKPKENVYAEERLRLNQDLAKVQADETIQAKAQAQLAEVQAKLESEIARFKKEQHEGKLTRAQVDSLSSQAQQVAEAKKAEIQRQLAEKELEIRNKVHQVEIEREKDHQIALLDLEKDSVDQQYNLGLISSSEQIDQLEKIENRKFDIERQSLVRRLAMERLEPQERAKIMADIAKVEDQRNSTNQQFGFQRQSLRQQSSPLAGVKAYIAEGKAALRDWKSITQQTLQGVENAFARGISGILSGQMTLGQGLKAIWEGITSTIIELLAQLAAKWIVTAIAAKIFKDDTASAAQESAVANQESAASQIWATYASIPYVGPVIAAAYIGVMNASLAANAASAKGIVGAAEGGWFDRPTRAIIGEGWQRELVVPEVSFQTYSKNLARNIIDNERQVAAYRRSGSAASSDGGNTIIHVHGHVLDQSGRGLQTLARANQRASIHSSSRSSYRINANERTMA